MRRIEHLINDVKFSTNEESNRFSNMRFNKLFNDAQDEIQRVIHTSNTNTKFFSKEIEIDLISGQELYDLPSDIYTESSINCISRRTNTGSQYYFSPMPQIGIKERRLTFGYAIQSKKVIVSPLPYNNLDSGLRINYTRQIPRLSARVGKIDSIIAGTITMTETDSTVNISYYDDYFCIVDKNGEIKDQSLLIDSSTSSSVNTSSTIVNGLAGDYIVAGYLATTNSELPDGTEKFMTTFVERQVHYINSNGKDLSAAKIFTDEEKSDIINLFSHNEKDTKYPEITDLGFF